MDVDLTKTLPEDIFVQRERFEFMVFMEFENIPDFCNHCSVVGHDIQRCKYFNRDENKNDNRANSRAADRRPVNERRRFVERAENIEPAVLENSDQLQTIALNEILQAYDDDFTREEQLRERRSWADDTDSVEEDVNVAHVSATPSVVAEDEHQMPIVAHITSQHTTGYHNVEAEQSPESHDGVDSPSSSNPARIVRIGFTNSTPSNGVHSNAYSDNASSDNYFVDADGFRKVLTKSQMRNWRKNKKRIEML